MAGFTGAPGPSDISSWQSQIIKPGAVISTNAQTNVGGATVNPVAVELYNRTPEQRKQIALSLRNAGYKVPANGVFSDSLVNAYSTAVASAQAQAMQLGQTFNNDFFIAYLARETESAGMGGAGGATTNIVATISSPGDAKQLINAVFRDQLGREASEKEIKRYTSVLRKAQRKEPTVTTYTDTAGGQMTQTTTGLNPQQFLMDEISGTDEAKKQDVMNFYDTFKRALGVL